MEVNIRNLILLIELEQFEEDAKEISKTIRFVLKKKKFYSILYSLYSVKFVLVYQFWKMKKRGSRRLIQYYFQNVMNKDYILIKICWFG